MSDENPRASLSDKQARGGVIGAKGYGFQAAYIVAQIPLWLADPDFVQFLHEGAGDVDVRFNRASGEERWYVQVKNHPVKPAEACEVLSQFSQTDAGSPDTYTRFTLACPGLHDKLKRLRAAVEDLRGAGGFFRRGKDKILDNTSADLEELVDKLELPVAPVFLVEKVYFDTDLAGLTDDAKLRDMFVGGMLKLDMAAGLTYEAGARAYEKLALLCHEAIRETCSRDKVQGLIRQAVAQLPPRIAYVNGLPAPPMPCLSHPYGMPKNWTGRAAEIDRLDEWLRAAEGEPVCCLTAIGGTGKSSLAWAWLQGRVLPRQKALGLAGIFQWSFYEGEVSFDRFLEDLGSYLAVSAGSDPVTRLTQRLSQTPILLVLDGFERLLAVYASPEAALLPEPTPEELEAHDRRCVDWRSARFLFSLLAGGATKTLLVSRLVPEEFDGRAGWLDMPLNGLARADAVSYLKLYGVKGTDRELEDAAGVYGFHPLSLSKLVEVLHYDAERPDDVQQAPKYDVSADLKARQHDILERAYDALPPELGQFVSSLAAVRGKPTLALARFLSPGWSDAEFSQNVRRLEEDRWVSRDRERETLDFHPLVRRCLYLRLKDKCAVHSRLADFFRPTAERIDVRKVRGVAHLVPVIELYHHTVHAGRYDEAHELFRDRLTVPLYYRFGAYQTCIELLRAFFPDGEEKPPRLKQKAARRWTLNTLGAPYSLLGQARRAVALIEMQNKMCESADDKRNLAIGLVNLVMQQLVVGDLAAAEKNLRRSMELRRDTQDEFDEAAGHLELGVLLARKGDFDGSASALAWSQELFDKCGDTNFVSVVRSCSALRALLMGNVRDALDAARKARDLADELAGTQLAHERDFIRAEWLLGWTKVELALEGKKGKGRLLTEAEGHLSEALTRCRRINNVELEPDILLAWGRWHRAKGEADGARGDVEEALRIADRCEYRLKQADCHNFLARLAMDEGNKSEAKREAEIAYERAWCDGPPHCYKPAMDEAERMLKELGAEPPRMDGT